MNLMSAICVAADYLGFAACDEASVAADSRFALLLRCANRVYREIATEYSPLKTTEKIDFTGGYFPFSNLSQKIYKVVALRKNGGRIKFKSDGTGIYADTDGGELEYRYVPPVKGQSEKLELEGLNEEVLAYGICAEYSLINGLYEKCATFREMYSEGVKKLCAEVREMKVGKRRWY